ncbi:hypothetical protein LTR97_011880 [Elasticomyces elasticus]|uniref:Uncharacterized protein n=1 Tax=Elasticomyces elasticus TaxID=574655 RepID=A0AAN7VLB3_9PEZI|nr:hypothetical protein LTR97_011880 [Elasticomyces elasticus]
MTAHDSQAPECYQHISATRYLSHNVSMMTDVPLVLLPASTTFDHRFCRTRSSIDTNKAACCTARHHPLAHPPRNYTLSRAPRHPPPPLHAYDALSQWHSRLAFLEAMARCWHPHGRSPISISEYLRAGTLSIDLKVVVRVVSSVLLDDCEKILAAVSIPFGLHNAEILQVDYTGTHVMLHDIRIEVADVREVVQEIDGQACKLLLLLAFGVFDGHSVLYAREVGTVHGECTAYRG